MGFINTIGQWARTNLAGGTDYVPADSLVNTVRGSSARGVLVGAGLGAAAGAGVGYAVGMRNLAADQVTVQTDAFEVTRPVLVGADYDPSSTTYVPDPDGDGPMTARWDHDPADWDPIVEMRGTGVTFTRDRLVRSMEWGPIQGALLGLGAGAVIGGLLGLVTHLVARGSPPSTETTHPGLARAADRAPLAGTAVGALAGGAAGFAMGRLSESKNVVYTQVVKEPVMVDRTLGWIPRVSQRDDIPKELFRPGSKVYYQDLPEGRFGNPPFQGSEAVVRKVPTGELAPRTVSEQSHALNTLTGTLIGVGMGAAIGLAGGVATGVVMKYLAREPLPEPDPWR